MKAYEIISEEQQLNELVPILAGIGIAGIISAISLGLSAWSAVELYDFLKKYNEDPDSITDEQWQDAFIDLALFFNRPLAKLGKGLIKKLIPDSWLKKGGEWLKEKASGIVRGKVKKEIKKRLTDPATGKPLTGAKRQQAIRDIARDRKDIYNKAGQEVVEMGLDVGLKALGLMAAVTDYKASCAWAKEQYELYSSDREKSEYSSAVSKEKAYQYYVADCDLALGAFVTTVGLILTPTPIAKILSALTGKWGKFLATVAGGIGGAAAGGTGGAVAGAAAGYAGAAGARKFLVPFFQGKVVDAATKAAIVAWLGTESGKEFLKLGIVRAFVQPIGELFKTIVNDLAGALEKFVGPNAASNAARSAVNPDAPKPSGSGDSASSDQKELNKPGVPWNLRVVVNGKKVTIGGKDVTDDEGKLLSGLGTFITDTRAAAKRIGIEDPFKTAKIEIPSNYNMSGGVWSK